MSDEDTSSKSSEYIVSIQLMALLALAEAAPQLSQGAIDRLRGLQKLQRPVTLDGLSLALWDIDEVLSGETPYRRTYKSLQAATPERVQLDDEALKERQPRDEGGSHGVERLGELVDLAQEDPMQLAKKGKWLDWLHGLLGLPKPKAKTTGGRAGAKGHGTKASGNGES